ncbi:polyprenyl synthetase family protein [Streptomyces rapamycinicus]|uniref:Dimethylallyltranstransferase n=2 Tax=Streptomyces rapamycinicus TaxID=1226757 RepID=A0A0A0NTC3_STRRN|nr:polyprenyl synthetase family protein [Streptomyces rapamycinicus]AGP60771.1 dimethylallyltranstransferase [Streptomyces rapamycinicus NRRL 5491]MBB4788063.1 geranylgeranyl diphosphate synthase type I [Streptomyces rapamycinicus]RLV72399.1 dimethylallyltranstransferase [Streptomyces rapamycinicus NRRL 5491]UTP36311.1 polyprenyl synthetase family protein [Streptomyces rapamycinicus NRRL 5491]
MTPPDVAVTELADPLAEAAPTMELLLRELDRRWPREAERLHQISRYALLPAGKLLRPLLLMESAEAVGGGGPAVVPAALSVEYLHVGSLVHDDVIDGDTMRRGRPSVAARYGTTDAIVTGDALMLGMFGVLTDGAEDAGPLGEGAGPLGEGAGPFTEAAGPFTGDAGGLPPGRVLGAVRVFARAGVDLCRGQAMESELRGDLGCGLDRYLTMSSLKTGALFRAACRGGAILGGGSPAQQHALTSYAEHLGLAFQMHDDLLPYTSDSRTTGKSALSDIAAARPTFPVLLCHAMADAPARARLEAALGGVLPAADALRTVHELLETTGALTAARDRATAQADRAKSCLEPLPRSRATAVLAAVADLSVSRDR